MPFPERFFEIAAGTLIVVLASAWLREKRPSLRGRRWLVAAWSLGWAASAGLSYYAFLQAQDALTSGPPDTRMSDFARWFDFGATWRLASLLVLVVGLVAVVAVVARTRTERASG